MAARIRVSVNVDFKKISDDAHKNAALLIEKAAFDVQAIAQERARVETGHMRNSIVAEPIGPLHWRVTGYAPYTIFNEFGTRFMSAQPMFVPAAELVGPQLRHALAMSVV